MKMMNNKTSLALAVATALGVVSPQALAIVKIASDTTTVAMPVSNYLPGNIGSAVKFATEQNAESTLALMSGYSAINKPLAGDLTAAIPVPAAYEVTSAKTLSIQVTLTNGAKFAVEPNLVCPHNGYISALLDNTRMATTVNANPALIASALIVTAASAGVPINVVNKSTATFNIPAGFTITNEGVCLLTVAPNGIASIANSAMVTAYIVGAKGTVDINVATTFIQGGVTATTSTAGSLLKFTTALKAVIDVKDIGGNIPTVTVDVKQGSKKFEAGATNIVSTTQATLGSVRLTSANVNATIRIASASAGGWDATSLMTTGTITISGALMATVQGVTLFPGISGCVGTPAGAGTPTTTTGGGGNVTITNVAVGALTAGLNICATVDGTKVLNAGQLSAVLVGGGADKFVPDLGAGSNIAEVKINGARLRVLNIPASDAADLAYIRFYNTSSQDIKVIGTLYAPDGTVLGTPDTVLFNPLKANDVEVLDAAKLATKLNIASPWKDKRAWLMVQAEVDRTMFRVQALIRSPSGALINMSTDTTN